MSGYDPSFQSGGGLRRPKGPLGDIEDRIRRALQQEGPIPLDLAERILPVVLGADMTLPGLSSGQFGRRWAAAPQTTNVGRIGLIATTTPAASLGILVEGITISTRVAASRVWGRVLTTALVASIWPGALATPNVFSTENKGVSTGAEIAAAINVIAVGGVAAPADMQYSWNFNGVAAPFVQTMPLGVFLPPGTGIEVAAVAATTEIDATFWGRQF